MTCRLGYFETTLKQHGTSLNPMEPFALSEACVEKKHPNRAYSLPKITVMEPDTPSRAGEQLGGAIRGSKKQLANELLPTNALQSSHCLVISTPIPSA